MKKFILLLAAFAALVSCTKENPVDENPVLDTPVVENQSITFEATAPSTASDDATKTTLVDGSHVHWVKGDEIKILFFPNAGWGAYLYEDDVTVGANGVFTTTFESETSATAYFSGEINWSHGSEYMDSGIAIYPSTVEASCNRPAGSYMQGNNTVITYDLSNEQTAVENSFQNGLAFSYAEIESEYKEDFIDNKAKLAFKNTCALIKVTLPADAKDIMSVKVESADANLAGDYKATISTTDKSQKPDFPLVLKDYGEVVSKDVTLSAPAGETLKAGASYYIVTWPGTHSNGLTFTFTNSAGLPLTKQVSQEVVLEASKIDHFNFKSSFTFEHIFEVSDDNFNFEGTASNGSFTVTSSRNWTASSDSDWLTVTPTSGAASESASTVSFNATQNNSGAERTARITITAGADTKVVTVTQAAFVPELSIERYGSWSELGYDGTDFQFVTIKSNTDWTLSCDQTWLTIGTTQGGVTTSSTVTLTAAKNESTSKRTATLYLRDKNNTVEKTFAVTQAGRPVMYYIVNQVTEASALENDGLYVIEFFGQSNYYWKVDNYGNVNKTYYGSTSNGFSAEYVYRFEKTNYSNPIDGYNSYSTGHLWSVKLNMYFEYWNLNFTEGSKTDLLFENKYGTEEGAEIDIYEHYNYNTLYWTGSKLAWGTTSDSSNSNRKWNIYKVEVR